MFVRSRIMAVLIKESPIRRIQLFGQDIWLDFIDRGLIRSGSLARLIEEDGISGVTSNPTIFEQSFSGGEYDDDIHEMAGQGLGAEDIYKRITSAEIRSAADVFMPLFESSRGRRGFVSLEVSPHLAYDPVRTVQEARELRDLVDRPNLLVKIPATMEGLAAIRQCISEGISINVTLLFGLSRYMHVAQAYIEGLEERTGRNESPVGVTSVASFFLSRIDAMVDPMLDRISLGGPGSEQAKTLFGQVASCCAKIAYQMQQEIFASPKFHDLAAKGATPQRLLWASTGTKNPMFSDIKYVEPLIGLDTINTMPMATLKAYQDHGEPESRLDMNPDRPVRLLSHLDDLGIKLDEIADALELEGVEKFKKPYDASLDRIRQRGAK